MAEASLNPLSDFELEMHIIDTTRQMETAYTAFLLLGDPKDREFAIEAMKRRDAAILARSEIVQGQRHSDFERRLDDGLDFFAVQGARDGLALRRAA